MRTTTHKLLFTLAAILFANTSYAEPLELNLFNGVRQIKKVRTQPKSVGLNKNYFKGYILDTAKIITSPFRWKKSSWLKASLIAGVTGGLYAYDQEIQDWVQDNRSSTSNDIAEFAKPFGNGKYTLPPLAALYLYGGLFEDNKAIRASLLSIESFAITGIFTQLIKHAGHRHRPSAGDPQNTWDGPGFSTSHLSFPSGHSSSVFAIGTVIATEYKSNPIIPPLAYSIATLAALSRINDNAHWASDVFFGSVIGYFTAKAIMKLHKKKRKKRVALLPVLNSKQSGILISYKF